MTALGSNSDRGQDIFTKRYPVVFPEFVKEVRLDTALLHRRPIPETTQLGPRAILTVGFPYNADTLC